MRVVEESGGEMCVSGGEMCVVEGYLRDMQWHAACRRRMGTLARGCGVYRMVRDWYIAERDKTMRQGARVMA